MRQLVGLKAFCLGEMTMAENGCSIWNDDIDAIDMAIAALREREGKDTNVPTKWISVNEKLPEAFVSVLVYMPEEIPLPTVHEGYVTNQGKWYAHFFEREPFEVTHWMPLPSAEGLE